MLKNIMESDGISERELLKNLVSSKEGKKTFAQLYGKYAPKCRAFVQAMTKDSSVAEDVTHDIFVKIWLKRDIVSKVDSFSSYLFRMVRNAVFDHYESNSIKRRYITLQGRLEDEFMDCVEEKVNLEDLRLVIFKAVSDMPVQRRRIFTLSRYEGLENKTIAEICNINIRTVENHITNALADIRIALSRI